MASNILTSQIDATFPVAGQDNDSQGFRTNFTQINTQLATAATEITSLQTNSAVTNADTNFNGNDQSQLVLKDFGQKIVAKGSVSGSVACSFADGNVTTLTTSGNTTLTFTNFPLEDDASTNVYASMRIILTKGVSTHTVTLTGIKRPNELVSLSDSSTVSADFSERVGVFVFDVFSVDGGTTKFMSQVLEYPS